MSVPFLLHLSVPLAAASADKSVAGFDVLLTAALAALDAHIVDHASRLLAAYWLVGPPQRNHLLIGDR